MLKMWRNVQLGMQKNIYARDEDKCLNWRCREMFTPQMYRNVPGDVEKYICNMQLNVNARGVEKCFMLEMFMPEMQRNVYTRDVDIYSMLEM